MWTFACVLREEHRGLAGRVAAADEYHLRIDARLRFEGRGPVPDSAAFELAQAWYVGMAIAGATGNDDRP